MAVSYSISCSQQRLFFPPAGPLHIFNVQRAHLLGELSLRAVIRDDVVGPLQSCLATRLGCENPLDALRVLAIASLQASPLLVLRAIDDQHAVKVALETGLE